MQISPLFQRNVCGNSVIRLITELIWLLSRSEVIRTVVGTGRRPQALDLSNEGTKASIPESLERFNLKGGLMAKG